MPKGKARKKKIPITATTPTSSSKPKSSRTVIRQYHVLLKQKAQLEGLPIQDVKTSQLLDAIQGQLDELGGLERYQQMSAIGQGKDRGGGSEKVAIPWLKDIYKTRINEGIDYPKLNLLEVGALKPDNYESCRSWIQTTPLDLHSQHPGILEQDFLLIDKAEHRGKWDIISLSLVLNFVPDPKNRGRMLRLAWNFLVPGGHLFFVLPLPCVMNSRYLDCERLTSIMDALGFSQVKERWKTGGKIIYLMYRRRDTPGFTDPFTKKTVVRQGDRNNFSILL
ncbi:nucleolus protein [Mycena sp. CBHHK59/15]|nr:nucleolus protein [Mycena sp. CBHHK59/15]